MARRHEQLPQPPSVWYTTGFLVPHVFQQEAGRTTGDEQLSFADLGGEEPSNDATHRLEKQEKDDDANDALDQASTRRSWFPSSLWPELHPGEGLHHGGHRHLGGLHSARPMETTKRSGSARPSVRRVSALDRWPRHQPRTSPWRPTPGPVSALDRPACAQQARLSQ